MSASQSNHKAGQHQYNVNAYKQHLDDALQVAQSFINGGVRVKAGAGKLVLQDSIQALCEALSLLLQPALLLLKLLVVPALKLFVSDALHFLSVSQFLFCLDRPLITSSKQ